MDPHAFAFSLSWQGWDDEAERGGAIEDGGNVDVAEAASAWGASEVTARLGSLR